MRRVCCVRVACNRCRFVFYEFVHPSAWRHSTCFRRCHMTSSLTRDTTHLTVSSAVMHMHTLHGQCTVYSRRYYLTKYWNKLYNYYRLMRRGNVFSRNCVVRLSVCQCSNFTMPWCRKFALVCAYIFRISKSSLCRGHVSIHRRDVIAPVSGGVTWRHH